MDVLSAANRPGPSEVGRSGAVRLRIPAITDFRAKGTIMGLAVLTAVFGMGTGVTPPVWSPEMYPAGGQAGRALDFRGWSHDKATDRDANEWLFFHDSLSKWPYGMTRRSINWVLPGLLGAKGDSAPIGVVKLLGC